MIQYLKYLLFPFSLLYKSITSLRNLLFDLNILPVFHPKIGTIGVGNLTVGGTGKTPVVDYLLQLFQDKNIGVISRGYGRKTKGFLEITDLNNAESVGDEPFMLFKNNPNVSFFVSENRVEGYKKSLTLNKKLDLILFDDVFQHRYIQTKLNILLCDFTRPFFEDFILPMGLLRESRKGAKRASLVLVTKCPIDISDEVKLSFTSKIRKYTKSEVFFANFENQPPQNIDLDKIADREEVILISGLANNLNFRKEQNKSFNIIKHFEFKDHYVYKKSDIDEVFLEYPNKKIVTTEKDYVKLEAFLSEKDKKKVYVVKQEVKVFEEEKFKLRIFDILNSTISK